MPSATQGFTRLEMVTNIADSVGNTSTIFKTRLETNIDLWQKEFYMLRDWSFSYKSGIGDTCKFALVAGQEEYTLSTAVLGFDMDNTNIEAVYTVAPGTARLFTPATLREIRVGDPGQESTGKPIHFAPLKHNKIVVWPSPTASDIEDVYIDGRVFGSSLTADGTYPDIPYKFQGVFMQYLLYKMLQRECDPRAGQELVVFKEMMRWAGNEDGRLTENTLRFRMPEEAYNSPNVYNLDSVLWNSDK